MSLRDELIGYYQKVVEIRRFEEEAARAYAQGKIGGFLHLYIGQEAVAVGAAAALEAVTLPEVCEPCLHQLRRLIERGKRPRFGYVFTAECVMQLVQLMELMERN